jgi:hypothetical protein
MLRVKPPEPLSSFQTEDAEDTMKMRLVTFGKINIEGKHYENDVVIEKGKVRKRKKRLSKTYRTQFGHTPLSAEEDIPWHGRKLFIGTGAYGSLPVMPEVYEEAHKKASRLSRCPPSRCANCWSN